MKENAEALNVAAQMRFVDDGLEVDDEIETDLQDWGIAEPGPERETRHEVPQAESFGVDDREVVTREETEQETLVADVADDQVTLGGEQAAGASKWG